MDEVLPPAAALMSAIYEEHKYEFRYAGVQNSVLKSSYFLGMKTVSCMSVTPERIPLEVNGECDIPISSYMDSS